MSAMDTEQSNVSEFVTADTVFVGDVSEFATSSTVFAGSAPVLAMDDVKLHCAETNEPMEVLPQWQDQYGRLFTST